MPIDDLWPEGDWRVSGDGTLERTFASAGPGRTFRLLAAAQSCNSLLLTADIQSADQLVCKYIAGACHKSPLAFGELLQDRFDASLQAVQADPAFVDTSSEHHL
jgi:hypothetical protein